MPHFLYRPHITGPENNVTTPDVMVDRVSLLNDEEKCFVPVHRLSSSTELQSVTDNAAITPTYALIACGGGVILGLGCLVGESGDPLRTADLLMSRSAWRLSNVIRHFKSLHIDVSTRGGDSTVPLSDLPKSVDLVSQIAGNELALPRGIMLLIAESSSTKVVSVPAKVDLQLVDDRLNRHLKQSIDLVSTASDPWPERPLPRYTVGPVGEVKHYI